MDFLWLRRKLEEMCPTHIIPVSKCLLSSMLFKPLGTFKYKKFVIYWFIVLWGIKPITVILGMHFILHFVSETALFCYDFCNMPSFVSYLQNYWWNHNRMHYFCILFLRLPSFTKFFIWDRHWRSKLSIHSYHQISSTHHNLLNTQKSENAISDLITFVATAGKVFIH